MHHLYLYVSKQKMAQGPLNRNGKRATKKNGAGAIKQKWPGATKKKGAVIAPLDFWIWFFFAPHCAMPVDPP